MYINKKLMFLVSEQLPAILGMSGYELLEHLINLCFYLQLAFGLGRISGEDGILALILSLAGILLTSLLRTLVRTMVVKKRDIYTVCLHKNMRTRLFQKLFALGPQFTDRKRSGELISTLWAKMEWLGFYYLEYLPRVFAALIISAGTVCWLLFIDVAAGLVLLVFTAGIMLMPPLFYRLVQQAGQKEWQENDRFYGDCLDGIKGAAMLKAFNANDWHRQQIKAQAEIMRKSTMSNLIWTTLNSRALDFLIIGGQYIPLLLAAVKCSRGGMAPFTAVVVFFVLKGWRDSVQKIMGSWLKGSKGLAGLGSIIEILTEECNYALTKTAAVLESDDEQPLESADIIFDQVSFSYHPAAGNVLDHLSVKVAAGTQAALIGSSGAGKSTLIQLLFGFYKPQAGVIRIGEMRLADGSVQKLQQAMTVIWQDSHIFNETCYDNIKMARPNASAKEIYQAAQKANLHAFIETLPQGYQTRIGDGGVALSGGEKQRMLLARAFLRDTPILILDEATASLDRRNEAEIQACLKELCREKTVLMITHRLDALEQGSAVYHIKQGRIRAKGAGHGYG